MMVVTVIMVMVMFHVVLMFPVPIMVMVMIVVTGIGHHVADHFTAHFRVFVHALHHNAPHIEIAKHLGHLLIIYLLMMGLFTCSGEQKQPRYHDCKY